MISDIYIDELGRVIMDPKILPPARTAGFAILDELIGEEKAQELYKDFDREIVNRSLLADESLPFVRVQNWLRDRGISLTPYLARKESRESKHRHDSKFI